MVFNFKGIIAATFTPFKESSTRSLQLDVIPTYAAYLKKVGIKGIYVNGTTGEGVSLSLSERKQVVEAWMSVSRDIIPTVIVQVGGTCLVDAKDLATHAETLGVSGVASLPDLFFKPQSVDELVLYCKEIASAAPKTPFFYYHFPVMTGVDLKMEEFLRKGRETIPTLAGAKLTTHNILTGQTCIRHKDLTFFHGGDESLLAAYSVGFDSAVTSTCNFLPAIHQHLRASVEKGDLQEARESQHMLERVLHVIYREASAGVAPQKAAMELLTSIKLGPPRMPLHPLNTKQLQAVKNGLQELGFL